MAGAAAAGALAIGALALLPGVAGASVSAHQQYENTTNSTFYVDQNGSGDECSQTDPCGSIGEALSIADGEDGYSTCYGVATIVVGPGTFYEDDDYLDGNPCTGSDSDQASWITIEGVPGQTYVQGEGEDETDYGIWLDYGSLTLEGLSFSGYDTDVYNVAGTLTVEDCSFTDSYVGVDAYDWDGPTTTSVADSTFSYIDDTGIYAEGDTMNVSSDTFFDGDEGVYADYGYVNVTNSTFNWNDDGIENDGAEVQVSFSTIDNNEWGMVQDYEEEPDVYTTMFATIVTNNYDDNCSGDSPEDYGYNIDNFGDCEFNPASGSVTGLDPELGALQDNGGYTWTQAILPTSVAHDLVPGYDCPATDQRGEDRLPSSTSVACDAGAYEWSAPTSIAFETPAMTGPTSTGANVGPIFVVALDADGLPAVSQHPILVSLSTTTPDSSFSLTDEGTDTTTVAIPSGSSDAGFFVGNLHPNLVPVEACATNALANLGCADQTETIVTGPAATVTETAGDEQTTDVGTAFSTDLAVNVVDGTDNPVDDQAVTFTVASGGATFPGGATSAVVDTDDLGDAVAPTLTAGDHPNDDVEIDVSTFSGGPTATFFESQVTGPPAEITILSGDDQSAVSGQPFSTELETQVTDRFGNPVDGATVVYAVTSGSASFGGGATADATTNGFGDSDVTNLVAGAHGGTETITATVEDTDVSTDFSGITITPLASTATVSTFALGKSTLSTTLDNQVSAIAAKIAKYGNTSVTLDGYADDSGSTALNDALSLARAVAVATLLKADLAKLHVTGVTITTVGKGATNFIDGNGKLPANRRVTAAIH